jgi:hypothetical protein
MFMVSSGGRNGANTKLLSKADPVTSRSERFDHGYAILDFREDSLSGDENRAPGANRRRQYDARRRTRRNIQKLTSQ